jgi:hypothetical protein
MKTRITVKTIHGNDIVAIEDGIDAAEISKRVSDRMVPGSVSFLVKSVNGNYYVVPIHNVTSVIFENMS